MQENQTQINKRPKCSCDQESGIKDRIRTAIRMGIRLRSERNVQADEDSFQYGIEGIVEGTAKEIIRELGLDLEYKNIRKSVIGTKQCSGDVGSVLQESL